MPHLACDIWTSDLRDRSLVLGGASLSYSMSTLDLTGDAGVRQRGLLIPDLECSVDVRRLETQSDVFALHQKEVCPYIL